MEGGGGHEGEPAGHLSHPGGDREDHLPELQHHCQHPARHPGRAAAGSL